LAAKGGAEEGQLGRRKRSFPGASDVSASLAPANRRINVRRSYVGREGGGDTHREGNKEGGGTRVDVKKPSLRLSIIMVWVLQN